MGCWIQNCGDMDKQATLHPGTVPPIDNQVKAVRIEAARRMAEISDAPLDNNQKMVFQAALEEYQESMQYSADFAFGRYNLANLYVNLRQPQKAVAAAEQSISLDPNGADGRAILGYALIFAGKFEESIASLEKAIRLNPIAPAWYFDALGKSCALSGHYKDAIAALRKALHRAPSDFLAHRDLTITYFLSGHNQEGRAQAKEVLKLNPRFSFQGYAKSLQFKNPADKMQLIDALKKAGVN